MTTGRASAQPSPTAVPSRRDTIAAGIALKDRNGRDDVMRRIAVTLAFVSSLGSCGQPVVPDRDADNVISADDYGDLANQFAKDIPTSAPTPAVEPHRLDGSDPDKPIRVRVGQELTASFSEHPSVGNTSELAEITGPVARSGGDYKYDHDGPIEPGGDAGTKTYRLMATAKGEATIRFVNKFRGQVMSEQIYRVIVE